MVLLAFAADHCAVTTKSLLTVVSTTTGVAVVVICGESTTVALPRAMSTLNDACQVPAAPVVWRWLKRVHNSASLTLT